MLHAISHATSACWRKTVPLRGGCRTTRSTSYLPATSSSTCRTSAPCRARSTKRTGASDTELSYSRWDRPSEPFPASTGIFSTTTSRSASVRFPRRCVSPGSPSRGASLASFRSRSSTRRDTRCSLFVHTCRCQSPGRCSAVSSSSSRKSNDLATSRRRRREVLFATDGHDKSNRWTFVDRRDRCGGGLWVADGRPLATGMDAASAGVPRFLVDLGVERSIQTRKGLRPGFHFHGGAARLSGTERVHPRDGAGPLDRLERNCVDLVRRALATALPIATASGRSRRVFLSDGELFR